MKTPLPPNERILRAGFVTLLSLTVALSALPSASPAEEAATPLAVTTALVQSDTVPVYEEAIGTVRPHLEAEVSAKVTGRIVAMHAVLGKKVKEGEILAEIEVDELKATLDRAKATLENATKDLERYRNLVTSGAVSKSEFDAMQMKERSAAAVVKETEIMIAYATLRAPFDGTITSKRADTGDLATVGRPLLSLENRSLLQIEVHLAESFAGQIELGDQLPVRIDSAGLLVQGTISEISPAVDPGSRTVLVKLDLEENEALRAGQFGKAFFPRGTRPVLSIPSEALLERGQLDYVFVVSEGIARLRIVKTVDGHYESTATEPRREILAGVELDEEVILSPPATLRDGQAVTAKLTKTETPTPNRLKNDE